MPSRRKRKRWRLKQQAQQAEATASPAGVKKWGWGEISLTRGDMRALRQALSKGWPVDADFLDSLTLRAEKALESDRIRVRVGAVETLAIIAAIRERGAGLS